MNIFRRKRFEKFFNLLNITESTNILAVGGLPYDWLELGFLGSVTCISLSNLKEGSYGAGNIKYLRLDAIDIPYSDKYFDVAFSNSLLEHVGRENQAQVAANIRRVAKSYWVQVPNRNFPYETHFKALFFYYMPLKLRRLIVTYWTSLVMKSKYYLSEVDSIYPLDETEIYTISRCKINKRKIFRPKQEFYRLSCETMMCSKIISKLSALVRSEITDKS